MTLSARLGGAALFVAAVAAAAALVHFVVVLLVPVVATYDAYARLSVLGPMGATAPLPRAGPGERRFPWDDPALAASVCRYDLSAGPLRVKAPVGRAGFASLPPTPPRSCESKCPRPAFGTSSPSLVVRHRSTDRRFDRTQQRVLCAPLLAVRLRLRAQLWPRCGRFHSWRRRAQPPLDRALSTA